MTEDEPAQKCLRILARLPIEQWRPMMRFAFLAWPRADHHTLDALFRGLTASTPRYLLPEDEGILIASGGHPAPQSAEPAPPAIAEGRGTGASRDPTPVPIKLKTPALGTAHLY